MTKQCEFYTYAYIDESGKPYYIGKGQRKRINQPRKGIPLPPVNRRIYLKKHLTEEEAFKHEFYMIYIFGRKVNNTGILLNITAGGQGTSGFKFSEESKKKMSEKAKVKVFSEEHRRKLSIAGLGNQRGKGHKHSDESKQRMSQTRKGKSKSQSHRENIAKALTGRKRHEVEGNVWWKNPQLNKRRLCRNCPGKGWIRGFKL